MPSKILSFKDLIAWQEAHKLVLDVYRILKVFPRDEQFALTNQLQRSAVSITSNIAEGFSRKTAKDKVRFYGIARGSLSEVESQIITACDLGYIRNKEEWCSIVRNHQVVKVDKLITGLIKSARDW